MKFAVTVFMMLLAVVGALIFMQFQVFSDKNESSEGGFQYVQEIEIEYRDGNLDVRHSFKNLPNDALKINWPNKAVDVQCFLDKKNACERLNESGTAFEAGDSHTQSISYVIPVEQSMKSSVLLSGVFAQLEKGAASFTTVHITTPNNIKGEWVTGVPLVGTQSLQLVNYSMFTGEGTIKDLYWQNAPFNFKTTQQSYGFYSNTGVQKERQQELTTLNTLSDDYVSIVKVKKVPDVQGYRILFVNTTDETEITRQLALQQLQQMYEIEKQPTWFKQTIASLLLHESIGYEKAKKVYKALYEQLNEAQMQQIISQIEALQGEVVTPTMLDEMISDIGQQSTRFMQSNAAVEHFIPFIYSDARPIFVDEQEQPSIYVVQQNDLNYYPTDAILDALGYKTRQGKSGYYVTDDTRAYRFPNESHNFYVFNQRRFDLPIYPFTTIGKESYIEETFLQKLFFVTIDKDETTIKLTTTAEQ